MGAYINPTDCTKEEWLEKNARRVPKSELANGAVAPDEMPVVYMDNGIFTAAGICFNTGEFHAFTRVDDPRAKQFFIAKIEDLKKVSDLESYLR